VWSYGPGTESAGKRRNAELFVFYSDYPEHGSGIDAPGRNPGLWLNIPF
jgi:hypothetical protein